MEADENGDPIPEDEDITISVLQEDWWYFVAPEAGTEDTEDYRGVFHPSYPSWLPFVIAAGKLQPEAKFESNQGWMELPGPIDGYVPVYEMGKTSDASCRRERMLYRPIQGSDPVREGVNTDPVAQEEPRH